MRRHLRSHWKRSSYLCTRNRDPEKLTPLAPCGRAQPATDLEAVVTTDLGAFRFEFAPDKAPKHVAQFIELARQGYYDDAALGSLLPRSDPLSRQLTLYRDFIVPHQQP